MRRNQAGKFAPQAGALARPLRGVTLTLWLPETVGPAGLVTIINRARKEARKTGDFAAAEILGKLLFLAHPRFHDMGEIFPPRFDEAPMTEVQLAEIRHRLVRLFTPAEAEEWLTARHPLLHNRRAIDCSYGEVRRVVRQMTNEAYT